MSFLNSISSLSRDAAKKAAQGQAAPNPVVHDVRSKEEFKLLDLEQKYPGLPLVLNFGSCT